MEILNEQQTVSSVSVITSEALMDHWQGHRRLTRRTIEAFPEEHFYTFSIGGMRSFAELIMELIGIAAPGVRGAVTGNWQTDEGLSLDHSSIAPATKGEMLVLWDKVTDQMNEIWPAMKPERFQEVDSAFGMYENSVINSVLYFIDNEIHHRGQAYVYLRALGVEPPAFWDR
ncbi:DinB family protein [Dyadobacter sp. CY312]|uniref:DinB family protein n=1 Tax=Dyadobacter sp. CY312 TaxID=2907303 RepID=UPI001F2D9E86|nr:DinB family protein [Dyadobacter sp. CY312]MCE7038750.1 DinB family protein [Dyadobacter sp. CY312]